MKRLYLDLEFPKIPILKTSEKNKQTAEQLEERGNNTAITSQLKQTDLGISQSQQRLRQCEVFYLTECVQALPLLSSSY